MQASYVKEFIDLFQMSDKLLSELAIFYRSRLQKPQLSDINESSKLVVVDGLFDHLSYLVPSGSWNITLFKDPLDFETFE